ncbi:MAG TPA: hypothetical protein VIU12_27370 [Chryseolinea sp.]
MKPTALLVLTLLALTCQYTHAQEADPALSARVNRFSFGASINQQGLDWGVGLEASTPAFWNKRLSIRLKSNMNWFEMYRVKRHHWTKYPVYTTLLVYNTRMMGNGRAFFEAGPFFIDPNQSFTNAKRITGVTGDAGGELFIARNSHVLISYFFSVGYAHCNAYAEKLEDGPSYGNGITFHNGFRFYL